MRFWRLSPVSMIFHKIIRYLCLDQYYQNWLSPLIDQQKLLNYSFKRATPMTETVLVSHGRREKIPDHKEDLM